MTTTSTQETPAVVERAAQPYAAIRRQVTMTQMGDVLPPLYTTTNGVVAHDDPVYVAATHA